MDTEKLESDKQETSLICDNDQHMASDSECTKDDENTKPAETDNQEAQSNQVQVNSEHGGEMDIYMEYGPKKRRINSPCSIFENRELIEKAMTKLAKEEDECGIFGRYVASVMRSLANESLKRKLKKRIQHILLDMADEEEKLSDIVPTPAPARTDYSPAI